MISDEEIQQFYQQGAVTVDTPLSPEQIAAGAAAVDELLPWREPKEGETPRYRFGRTCDYFHPALLELIQEPFFEDVAGQVLQSQQVRFFQTALVATYPQVDGVFSFFQHVDVQYCSADFQAVPRNIVCSFFLWLEDVTPKRAPLMYRPGSHRLLATYRDADPHLCGQGPRVAGVLLDDLPDLPYSEPEPVVARAGQVTVLTTAMVHGASTNIDDKPRKALVITFTDAGVEVGLPEGQAEAKKRYDGELKEHLRPERAHIIS
ncbi:MAG: hypothetical protein GKR89_00130 [Candidatus Latescibacteria bacterium]|nr:hypothetical protein [Candidatus Latescibacterota bacterium]